MNGLTCGALGCKHNDRAYPEDGWGGCKFDMSDLELDKLAKCTLHEPDMEYLREKWVYVKGRDHKQNKPGYSSDAVEDECVCPSSDKCGKCIGV